MTIFATFDLATQSAVCYGRADTMPVVEVVRAPGAGDNYAEFGAFYWRFFNRILDKLAALLEPDEFILVGFEAPILPRPKWDDKQQKMVMMTNLATTRKLGSLGVMLEAACELHSAHIETRECNVKSAKVQLTGRGDASKLEMVYAARRAGIILPPGDEAKDGADAFAVFVQAVRYWAPQHYEAWLKRIHGQGRGQERMSAAEARRLL